MARLYVYTAVFLAEERRRTAKRPVPTCGFPAKKRALIERMRRAARQDEVVAMPVVEPAVAADLPADPSWPPAFLTRSLEIKI